MLASGLVRSESGCHFFVETFKSHAIGNGLPQTDQCVGCGIHACRRNAISRPALNQHKFFAAARDARCVAALPDAQKIQLLAELQGREVFSSAWPSTEL
jgi:hypothetical protein